MHKKNSGRPGQKVPCDRANNYGHVHKYIVASNPNKKTTKNSLCVTFTKTHQNCSERFFYIVFNFYVEATF